MTTLIHLVRHAEVHNPESVWYGRLEGFPLSERGRRQAEALAGFFSKKDLAAVYSSPLTRALETAEAIAKTHDLEVVADEDLIESETLLQGKPGDRRLFRNPMNLKYFVNPFRPSWGESYKSTATRMIRAVHRMREAHEGREAVAVSHMTPIVVARMRISGNKRPAWMTSQRIVGRASVSTFEFNGSELKSLDYTPVGRSIT